VCAGRSRETLVRRQESGCQALGQRYVRSVVRGEVRSQFQDPHEQLRMTVSDDRQVEVVLDRLGRSFAGDRSAQHRAAQPGDDLHVAECWDVQIDVVRTHDLSDRRTGIRTEEIFQ
jgi:hypothetical protein